MGKGSQVERRRGRRWERGAKVWLYRCLLPPEDTQALWDFTLGSREGRTGTQPYQKSEPEFEFSAKKR